MHIKKETAYLMKLISGKHNGVVNGRKYFACKDKHGLMVKPRTISVHGINGSELLRPESYYPI